jgi:hypothetical protein
MLIISTRTVSMLTISTRTVSTLTVSPGLFPCWPFPPGLFPCWPVLCWVPLLLKLLLQFECINDRLLNLTINWGIYVCVCVCVCPVKRFQIFSTDSLKIWREHSMGYDMLHGLYMCAHNMCMHACMQSVRACVHLLIFEWIMSKFAGNILRLIISGKD